MRQVCKEIGLVAAHDFPVIITGEIGTGKEPVARAIHKFAAAVAGELNLSFVPGS